MIEILDGEEMPLDQYLAESTSGLENLVDLTDDEDD
jgi:hypothetical protein